LTATNQNVPPEPIHALSEGAQLIHISRNSVVLVVAVNDLPKPCTNLTDTIMLPAEKLCLDGFQLRNHSLFRRNPPDGEGVGLVTSPALNVRFLRGPHVEQVGRGRRNRTHGASRHHPDDLGWRRSRTLLVDWRSATGQAHGKLMGDFLPFSGNNAVGFFAAKGAK
jgi:hypothetical protein